jgi:hypothetical protein
LCQRKLHQQQEIAYKYPGEAFRVDNKSKMSLADVLRVKRMADNISFLRLFFLKTPDSRVERRVEIIDCVLSIFFFELTRAFRASMDGMAAIYSKDQFTFKIVHFFSTLKLAKPCVDGAAELFTSGKKVIVEDSDEDVVTEDEDSADPLSHLIAKLKHTRIKEGQAECANCLLTVQENPNFKTLYKTLIESVITNL